MSSLRALGKPSLLAFALVAALGSTHADAAKKKAKAPAVSAQCSDFYASANADWLKANTAGSALGQLRERSQQQQRDLLQAAMQSPQGNVQKLLGDFWASGLDEAAVEADGARPIAPLLDRINAIRKPKEVAPAIAALHQVGIPVAFNFSPDVDLRALDRHIGYFMQGGLGLPDPAYYTRSDADTQQVMTRYRAYVKQILALTGSAKDKLDADAQAVIDLETRLARVSKPLVDLRNPLTNYAPVATKELGKQYKNLQLDAFLKAQGVNDDTVSMADAELFRQIDALIASLKPDQWKAYLRWRVGDAMAPHLAKSFRDAEFEFRGRVMRGQSTPPPRWQEVLDAINLAAGPMLGKEYAARYLPQATDSQAEAIAAQVRDALERRLEASSWLSAQAKSEAKDKLEKLKIEVGTPHRDIDYSVQPMGRGSFGGNILIASTWRHREEMKRIGKGNADRRWDVLPQQPALAYDLAQNRLIVTAAVLQAPVYDASRDPAGVYGAYGALVGRELNRGFDNRGRMVDAKGQIRDWWSPADLAAWTGLTGKVASQFDGYNYPELKNVKVNGKLVADESTADLAGVELAWDAYQNAQPQAGTASKQAFFQAWAQLWAQKFGEADAAQRAASDVHAPGVWRTNAPLANLPAFAATYTCKPGQPMQRSEAEQVRIWR
ncbi:M13 family metallopeptidase [Pseudoxanthomonas indica]|uniref:Putative endopeptidase n=1 Tax=Pseudoxanthomonas indica TaxID=428993 RepID=A0A1T5J9T1_9GAMM|nr:M13 family metallopeptidase [Pseudoxanthomonas indica]GGD57466.1 peptidase M13 [Pseudoxanthomonas indica]SKC48076.1 putative endopeptidase [Pseudoxanthomonas indica]